MAVCCRPLKISHKFPIGGCGGGSPGRCLEGGGETSDRDAPFNFEISCQRHRVNVSCADLYVLYTAPQVREGGR